MPETALYAQEVGYPKKIQAGFWLAIGLACATARGQSINLGNILPLGDSITQGLNTTPYPTLGAWRLPFYQDATNAGDSMQFVGTSNATSDPTLINAGQAYHDGHSGYEINNDNTTGRGGIDELFKSQVVGHIAVPNYVMLMIGTNDVYFGSGISTIGQRYMGLLTDIHTAYPSAKIICSSIIPDYATAGNANVAADRLTLNSDIQADVSTAQSDGWPVYFVDAGNQVPANDYIDQIHPNAAGDAIIGQAFFNAAVAIAPPPAHSVQVISGFNVSGSVNAWASQFDIHQTDYIVRSGDLAQTTNQLQSGYAGGAWTGNGIVSSSAQTDGSRLTAVGVANGFVGSFDGMNISSGDLVVKYTYYGDANLDGTVNSADYTLIDNGFLTGATGWQNGDFNYDGVINGSDYTLIDNAFNRHGGSLAVTTSSQIVTIPVPEPAAGALLMVVGGCWRRRRSG